MKIRLGMIGGGPGSFIGAVHRKAAALDAMYELVCGSFSSNPEKSKETGSGLQLDPDRVYGSYQEMISRESALDADLRMQAVSIVTPNHLHAGPAIMALEHGFHVIIDKPLAFSLDEARQIQAAVKKTGLVFALTHTYAGYPMIKEARNLVRTGKIGTLRKIFVEYPQGWLSAHLEKDGQKQASWRTDPSMSGAGGSVGDIGTHAAHLAEYVSGLKIVQVCGELNTKVEGRLLDDDAAALLRFENGVSGVLMATQIAAGEENNLKMRIYGEKGGLEWSHADPNTLLLKPADGPVQVYRTGSGYVSDAAAKFTRLPAGHPEGYIEAFANIYTAFAEAVTDHTSGRYRSAADYDFPTVDEGVRGMAFIETMVASSASDKKWTNLSL
ncbi:MAG: gfo/Idh/MocA family oxidoreductase [Balneolaceae bacterium]|nr:MAG: gfo/Idh/MocA family oxidoreductase [Balneolaceae bacterium]